MQAQRFEDVFFAFQRALLDADMRESMNRPQMSRERDHTDAQYEAYDPRRPVMVPTQALFMQVASDYNFFLNSLRHVLRAVDHLPVDERPRLEGLALLKLLRDYGEHWDEPDGRSARSLAANYPEVSPHSFQFTNDEIWIAGVPLSEIRAYLDRADRRLRASLRAQGLVAPDCMDSDVEGDDSLPWPQDRWRYRYWALPTFPEDEWTPPLPDLPVEPM